MCEQCSGLIPVVKLKSQYEYFELLEQLRGMLTRKSIRLVDSTCDLEEVKPDGIWANDYIEHVFECTECGQHFHLGVEPYHGSGGTWEPTERSTRWLSHKKGTNQVNY